MPLRDVDYLDYFQKAGQRVGWLSSDQFFVPDLVELFLGDDISYPFISRIIIKPLYGFLLLSNQYITKALITAQCVFKIQVSRCSEIFGSSFCGLGIL